MVFGPDHAKAPWPYFDHDDVKAAVEVLQSGRVNQWTGPVVGDFEKQFANYCEAKYGIALANGTVAIELALRGLKPKIGMKGSVVVPAATFIGTATAVVAAGFRPLFADVDPDSHCVTAESLNAAAKADTVAVVPVHFGGHPAPMDEISELAREKDWALIEDCAQAHGARYRGKPVGSFGDVGCFSFCQDKILTTGGEGGFAVTADEELFHRMWSYKDHGKDFERVFRHDHPPGFRWVNDHWGTNWRMSAVQAAIGLSQLQKMHLWLDRRRENAGILRKALADVEIIRLPKLSADVEHAYYKFYGYVAIDCLRGGWTRERIVEELSSQGVPVSLGSASEVYKEQCVLNAGWAPAQPLREAARLGRSSLCFQVHPTITASHMTAITESIVRVLEDASG